MVRHLQLHAEQQPVPQTAPVNPVPHLETNEKHFDKMVNLASSSIASRAPEKLNKTDRHPVVNLLIPPEAASRYPKYVPDRQRYTCGAKGCCYISVDETMLKYHWETLHSGTNDFHCVHCPPYQHLDTTKPLTACRIIAHLKMHDIRLYACSSCSYYHHRRQVLDKHIAEIHSTGHVMVVREESVSQTLNVSQPSTVAPTMDLKPWQCGLCKFKSMLRPEVVEHCAKIHQSKMQYKCTYCAFRTSTLENITKHQSKSHAGKAQETFYFYYREGSIPDEPDGTPRWQKQRQKSSATETEVKTETIERTELESQSELTKNVPQSPARPTVDLNIVKQDPDAVTVPAHTTQDLCKTFGQFCEPNGLKYKCPLCKNTVEDSRDAMQSHLYEELQCRKWGCGFCSYKAFHKNGLNDHMLTEHRNNREPIELPVDVRVETWIAKLLDHQFLLIEKNKQNLTKQITAVVPVNSAPTTSKSQDAHMNVPESDNGHSEEELEKMFGTFGTPENKSFNCPKCSLKIREESAMRDHLEIELNKIRWCCNSCTEKFQNYHEAQFHCKSVHPGITARAIEAVRNVGMRSAWISAVIRAQKLSMNHLPVTENTDSDETIANSLAQDNSLLVVRYEERVPTPDIQVVRSRTSGVESDEDEEKLVIDEVFNQVDCKQCPFCIYTCQDIRELKEHVVGQHNNIKPYFCFYCDFNGYRKTVVKHVSQKHKDKPLVFLTKGQRILGGPTSANAVSASAPVAVKDDATRLICLRCEKPFNENEAKTHFHDNTKPKFAKTGQTVVKCRVCLTLHENIDEAAAHHHTSHPNKTFKYITFKLHCNKRSIFSCAYCDQNFSVWADLKVHWRLVHSSLPFKFNKGQCAGTASDVVINLSDDEETGVKRKSECILINPSTSKMCARKSTTKLPIQAVAKKSTTKLPFNLESDSDATEYSFYGSKPQVDDLDNVTTNMSFCNTVVPFTFKKLSEVIRINPTVLVEDIKK
ncbi:unnamed protein product [Parnassius apollo]|uniref:(apollo) hypothetical protein n=1 Tax=Parnassius apollo TaxID=110799 RepID=A0A8S3XXI9_PARAO|nr:unnamed protein product [Parnassius apollo]